MGPGRLTTLHAGSRGLVVVAAKSEAESVLSAFRADPGGARREWTAHRLDARLDLVISGIGKSNAAGATADLLARTRYGAVVNLGVCGSLPRAAGAPLPPRTVVLGTSAWFADEGVCTPKGFEDVATMGFGPLTGAPGGGLELPADAGLVSALRAIADVAGPIATVSSCSGTDALALEISRRTGAVAEAMEGAAVALACARSGAPFVELRVVSNSTGDRASQRWDIKGALARLAELAMAL